MALSTGIILGLFTALFWGIGDFIAKLVIDKIGPEKTLFYAQLFGLLPLIAYFYFTLGHAAITNIIVISGIFLGLLGVVFYLTIYKAFEFGPMSVASPIVASWGMITALLSLIFFHESLSSIQTAGIIVIIAGLILATYKKEKIKTRTSKGILFAIISMLGWGFVFFAMKPLIDSAGAYIPVIFLRVVAVLVLLLYLPRKKINFSISNKKLIFMLMLVGLFDISAFISYTHGVSTELVSLVSPLAALFPAITILLSRIFLKERIQKIQNVGIFSILAGLVMISVI